MNKKIVFVDLDGVLADFTVAAGLKRGEWVDDPPAMFEKGFFLNLPIIPSAKLSMKILLDISELDIYIATKPTTKNMHSATEKYQWVNRYFPELLRKIFLTCDKGLLRGDYLIDDSPRWSSAFKGKFLYFDEAQPETSWKTITDYFLTNYKK